MPQLTFNPGLTLTGFRTTRPMQMMAAVFAPLRMAAQVKFDTRDKVGSGANVEVAMAMFLRVVLVIAFAVL